MVASLNLAEFESLNKLVGQKVEFTARATDRDIFWLEHSLAQQYQKHQQQSTEVALYA